MEDTRDVKSGVKVLARKIKHDYQVLRRDPIAKYIAVYHAPQKREPEITVVNDAGFRAVEIGDTCGRNGSYGYMYLFYTNDNDLKFPTVSELEKRLFAVLKKEVLAGEDVSYHNWPEYGSLEKQRDYFSDVVKMAALNCIKKKG